ncbi:MAG: ribonuclease III [Candidatus Colwellbacteria bacterium CG10_big_fil_rev_8_21_14_0_10_42_22]|uniref:Ribonuclease 3 n=1 Tax=Candidatus Colwellbacteria bacterium CG10_big_fil_rev_8_21_14_0_10_42_22 TaxID=1974540 RepID=A0A2H0VHH1_9BACT|nr:MAG: ribonuclease III [Candidatus Colwellbacteria bacterium CG10_big_fil_rev_8_21_14_0_10_42_22]
MNLKKLQEKIGIEFRRISFYEEALTHRSYLNENPSWPHHNNERLEFLGDAVLELAVTEEIYKRLPDEEEGRLTVFRAALVNTKALAGVAKKIGLDKILLLSKGEAKDSNGKGRESISANVVEALIGAIYLDLGYDKAKSFIENQILTNLDTVVEGGGKDAKSLVQEHAQAQYKITPTYEVLDESGPAHDRHFKVGLYFEEELKSQGEGPSKQEAELDAAEKYFAKIKN